MTMGSIEREKECGEGGRRKHHFREMRQPSAMPADDRDSGDREAQLLWNGGKIEPYTIIIMVYHLHECEHFIIWSLQIVNRGRHFGARGTVFFMSVRGEAEADMK
jgi:hypothetical protein